MRKIFLFFISLLQKIKKDDMLSMANELAYKMLLAFFPLVLFILSVLGFLNLDGSVMLNRLYSYLPGDISELIIRFIAEVYDKRSKSLMSTSLLVSVYNASNGFHAVMRCINKAYGYKDERGFFTRFSVRIVSMLIFTLSIALMLIMWIFGSSVMKLIYELSPLPDPIDTIYQTLSAIATMFVLILAIMLIYKLACAKPVKLMQVFPGACVTVLLWVISSELFSFFITNFGRFSVLYGSVAGMFILIVWLNLISSFLLLGSEINALLIVE